MDAAINNGLKLEEKQDSCIVLEYLLTRYLFITKGKIVIVQRRNPADTPTKPSK